MLHDDDIVLEYREGLFPLLFAINDAQASFAGWLHFAMSPEPFKQSCPSVH